MHNLTGLPYWKITAMMTGGKKPSQNHWWIGKEAVKRIYETVKAEADNPPALFNHLYKKEKENIQWRSFKPPHN